MEYEILIFIGGIIFLGIVALTAVFHVISKIYPYAYSNARIRAMNARILKREDFELLLEKPYNEIIYSLDRGYYPELSNFAGADFSYSSIDSALREHLIRDLAKIYRISPQSSQKFLKTVLSKYDIQVIQSILRATHAKNLQPESIKNILSVTEVFHRDFLDQGKFDVPHLLNELKGTSYYDLIEKHLENIQKGKFLDFELEMDLHYFSRLLHEAKTRPAKQFVKRMIDMQNVSLVLKGKEAVIPGGKIELEKLEKFTKHLDLLQLSKLASDVGYEVKNVIDKSDMERQMYLDFAEFGKSLLKEEPQSESTLIGFIVILRTNARNVNILLKLKSHGFSAEKIKGVLAL